MKKMATIAMLALLVVAPLSLGAEKTIFEQDFESPDAAKALARKETVLSEPGYNSGRCMSRATVDAHNNLGLKIQAVVEDGMELTFNFRTEVRAGEVRYIGIYLITPEGKKMLNAKTKPSSQWKSVRIPLSQFSVDLGSAVKEPIRAGETINMIVFNGRGADKTADQTVYIDNVKLVVK